MIVLTTNKFERPVRENLKKFNYDKAQVVVVDQYSEESIMSIQQTTSRRVVLVFLDFEFYQKVLNAIGASVFISDFLGWSYTDNFTPLDFYPDLSINKVLDKFEPSYFLDLLRRGYAEYFYEMRSKFPTSAYSLEDIIEFETVVARKLRPLVYHMKSKNPYYHPLATSSLSQSAVVFDCGACSSKHGGEIVTQLAKSVPNGHVHAFEPVKEIYDQLVEDIRQQPFSNTTAINAAVWKHDTLLRVKSDGMTSKISDGGFPVQAVSIDSYFDGKRVDFIKMDIEGAEVEALMGAEKTIRKHKPSLAICAYHKPGDTAKIVTLLEEYCPEYNFWLECNEGHAWCGTKIFANVPR